MKTKNNMNQELMNELATRCENCNLTRCVGRNCQELDEVVVLTKRTKVSSMLTL